MALKPKGQIKMSKKTIVFKDCFTTDKENIEQAKKRTKRKNVDTRKVKVEKLPKTAKTEKETWKEIKNETDKKEFQAIIHILNRYYSLNGVKNEFREKLVLSNSESFTVKLKAMAGNSFSVLVELNNVLETWVHIDGIVEERKIQTEKGNLDHPVFKIVCLTDLYENAVKCKTPKLINLKVGKK